MKGVKYLCTALLTLCITCLLSLKLSSNASAINYGTASLDLNFRNNNQGYQWQNNIYFGRQYGISISYGSARIYQFNTPQITTAGTTASVHFETNIVASTDDIQYVFGYFVNLNQQQVRGCSWQGQPLTMSASSLGTALTEWTEVINGVTYYNVTLTLYGDVALSGFPNNSQGVLTCSVGSLDYAFYDNPTDNPDLLYFEQNPLSVSWSNNINDALLQTQINQNTTIINQNQQIIDQDNQDRQDLQNTSDSASDTATNLGNQVTARSTNLITLIGNFINVVLNPPASDCVIDGDMGHMDLGDIDLCELSPPPAISVIGGLLILGMLIPLVLAVIWRFIRLLRYVVGGT